MGGVRSQGNRRFISIGISGAVHTYPEIQVVRPTTTVTRSRGPAAPRPRAVAPRPWLLTHRALFSPLTRRRAPCHVCHDAGGGEPSDGAGPPVLQCIPRPAPIADPSRPARGGVAPAGRGRAGADRRHRRHRRHRRRVGAPYLAAAPTRPARARRRTRRAPRRRLARLSLALSGAASPAASSRPLPHSLGRGAREARGEASLTPRRRPHWPEPRRAARPGAEGFGLARV